VRKQFVISMGLLTVSACLIAGCMNDSKNTTIEEKNVQASDDISTAASADFVNNEVVKVERKTGILDDRVNKLEAEIDLLLANGETEEDPLIFSDVKKDYWAHEEIMSLYHAQIIMGYPQDKMFYPERSLTRYQAASMLVKAFDLPLSDAPSVFKDVNADHSGLKEIMAAYENGIFTGSDGFFLPNEPMKRRHMAMVLQRALHLEATDAPFEEYVDVPSDMSGYEAVKAITQHGIAKGSDGYFKPEDPTKRSHFSAFIYRAINN
jgi:S-layer homology domain